MTSPALVEDDHRDDHVDEDIYTCLNAAERVSFFLFAGAGSGKTRSLVNALQRVRTAQGRQFWLRGQRIRVITYTNAACDEIIQRLEFDPLIEVSTIHSFAWSLISGFNADIKQWLHANLLREIEELQEAQRKGRAGTQASKDREKSIETKSRRIANLDQIKRFIYSPNGDNRGRDSLNHSEVIKITSSFLLEKPALALILVSKHPILLIDESQDTNKDLMDGLLSVQARYRDRFCLGLFGDTMQRIYADGKVDLSASLAADWARPAKKMNHRCPKRIIRLINKIRSAVDEHDQIPRSDKSEGVVRLFIVTSEIQNKFKTETAIVARMAEITGDKQWSSSGIYKTLILEHHMAARRMGFADLFIPLYEAEGLKEGLLEGSLPSLRLFTHDIMPLIEAMTKEDKFSLAAIARKRSPLLDKKTLLAAAANQPVLLRKTREATETLYALWKDKNDPKLIDILKCIQVTGLFEIPDILKPIAMRTSLEEAIETTIENDLGEEDVDETMAALEASLEAPFSQVVAYSRYMSDEAPFDTHQGVKGREFPRVMVIMDDEESKGFLFKYEKLFGAKEKADIDIKNEREGKETGIDRARRLFYVTCSRAEESLALVAYTQNPSAIKEYVIKENWFEENEIEIVKS